MSNVTLDVHPSGIRCTRLLDPRTRQFAEPSAFLCAWQDQTALRDWYGRCNIYTSRWPEHPLKNIAVGGEYAIVEILEQSH